MYCTCACSSRTAYVMNNPPVVVPRNRMRKPIKSLEWTKGINEHTHINIMGTCASSSIASQTSLFLWRALSWCSRQILSPSDDSVLCLCPCRLHSRSPELYPLGVSSLGTLWLGYKINGGQKCCKVAVIIEKWSTSFHGVCTFLDGRRASGEALPFCWCLYIWGS